MVSNFIKSLALYSIVVLVGYSLQGPSIALAQVGCTGNLQPGTVCGNPNGTEGVPSATVNPVLGGGATQGTITLTPGSTPSSLVNGLMWATNAGVFAQINGGTVALGTSSSFTITVGSTVVSGASNGNVLYNNSGVVGSYSTTGTGSAVLSTSPTLVTPSIGVATATSINGVSITSASGAALSLVSGATLAQSGAFNLTLTVTAPTNVTLPTTGTLVNSAVTTLSSLVSVGTLTGGATGAGFTVALGTSTITGQLAVSNGGTGLASGTSGGVLAFTGSTTIASSGALTLNAPVIGGGAGAAPTVGTRAGNTTAFGTVAGVLVSGHCVSIDANLNFIDAGGACTTGGGGGTVNSATAGQLAYYATTSTIVSGNANVTISSGALTLGVATSVQGSLKLSGSSSGTITIIGQAAAGTYEFDLPTTAGSSGQPLLSAGGAGSPMTFGTLSVGAGGTGRTTLTNHGVLVGAATSAITQLSAAAAGTALTGQGTGSDPSFTATPTLGVQQTTQGQIILANTAAGSFSTTLQSSNSASAAWTMTLPVTAGTSGFVLQTDGTGITSWVANAASLTVGGTSIASGTNGRVLYDNSGTLGELSVTGTGNVVLATSPTITTPTFSGTVTGPSGTWTVASGLSVTGGGIGIVSGISGGVLYFSASTTIASSGALTANLPVIGGGAGSAPTVGARSGNTTTFATTTGSLPSGDLAKFDASGNIVDGISIPVTVANGGTGNTTATAHSLPINEGASAQANTGAGTTGQCIVSQGGSADPVYKSGCKVLITTLTASSSASLSICPGATPTCTFTFDLSATYNEIEFVFENVLPASNATCEITVQIGTNTAFKATAYLGRGGSGTNQTTFIPCSDTGSTVLAAGTGVSGTVTLHAPTNTLPLFVGQVFYVISGPSSLNSDVGGVWYNSATGGTVTGVSIAFSTGNIASGNIKVYGYL